LLKQGSCQNGALTAGSWCGWSLRPQRDVELGLAGPDSLTLSEERREKCLCHVISRIAHEQDGHTERKQDSKSPGCFAVRPDMSTLRRARHTLRRACLGEGVFDPPLRLRADTLRRARLAGQFFDPTLRVSPDTLRRAHAH
jgi:hypothetical protein